jgi:hypothetical protein
MIEVAKRVVGQQQDRPTIETQGQDFVHERVVTDATFTVDQQTWQAEFIGEHVLAGNHPLQVWDGNSSL